MNKSIKFLYIVCANASIGYGPKSRNSKSRNPKSRQVQNPDRYKIPTGQNPDRSKSRQVKILTGQNPEKLARIKL